MNRIPISTAAAALLRALISRAGVTRDRILLSDVRSTDWRSLTFNGERHELHLRITGSDCSSVVERMCDGLEDEEFSISGAIVADIAVVRSESAPDGSTSSVLEALTIEAD